MLIGHHPVESKAGWPTKQGALQQDSHSHRDSWNLHVHQHPDRTWRFHDFTHKAGGKVLRLTCSSLVSSHLLLLLLPACSPKTLLVGAYPHTGAHNEDYMAYIKDDPIPNNNPILACFGGRAASVPSPAAQLSPLTEQPLLNLGWVR